MSKDLEFALRLADEADEISLSRFRALDLNVETKPDRTPVTDADRAVEARIRELISEYSHGDTVIGEEFGAEKGDREWIIDPIDGTANFLRGIPIWATLIALRVGGELKASVVSAPALGRRWWAERGAGSFTRDIDGSSRSLSVSNVARLEDAYVSFNSISQWDSIGSAAKLTELSRATWRDRAFGDFLSYMYVAEGVIEMAAEPDLKLHDIAALVPIVEEAGGRLTALDGELNDESSAVLASNSLLHAEFLRILG